MCNCKKHTYSCLMIGERTMFLDWATSCKSQTGPGVRQEYKQLSRCLYFPLSFYATSFALLVLSFLSAVRSLLGVILRCSSPICHLAQRQWLPSCWLLRPMRALLEQTGGKYGERNLTGNKQSWCLLARSDILRDLEEPHYTALIKGGVNCVVTCKLCREPMTVQL